ncbi:MAG: rhodanese-related sulfurtransferase [Wenzhouxiangella sp.]
MELLSAYQFLSLDHLPLRRERMRVRAGELGLLGTVLLAEEGINFSLGGRSEAVQTWVDWLADEQGIDRLVVNRQTVEHVPFLRLRVRVRPEIITFDPALKPAEAATGTALDPLAWHQLLQGSNVQLVDTRNQYEVELGTFRGAVDPATDTFTEFRDWALSNLDRDQPVAMFCTGGVRCEKASAWLLANGYDQVYQLEGGILNYMRTIPASESMWEGECFVFDDRVSIDHRLQPVGRPVCANCRLPVPGLNEDGMPPVTEHGGCGLCDEQFSPARLAGLRERVRQIALARSRGQNHLGPQSDDEAHREDASG